MHGWTLETVRGLSADDYHEICEWLNEKADRARGDQSVDMDALIRAARGGTQDDG